MRIAMTPLHASILVTYQSQAQHDTGSAVPANGEVTRLSGSSNISTLYSSMAAINRIYHHAAAGSSEQFTYQTVTVVQDLNVITMSRG